MNGFWDNLFRRSRTAPDLRAVLGRVPLFERLSRRELAAVERILYRRTYRAGEVVFRQGEPGVGMYVVVRGAVEILHEPTGQRLAVLSDGDFFGEIALLSETPRSATARAETDATLLGFFQPELLDLLARDPRLGVKVLLPLAQIAGQRLIHSDAQLTALRAATGGEAAAGDGPDETALRPVARR